MILGYLLATLIGISLGLLGGGGSILTVPILVYVLMMPAKTSIALSLIIVGVTALISAMGHWKNNNINFKMAFLFAPIAMVGAFGGARLSKFMSGSTQLILFAIIMLMAAIFMFKNKKVTKENEVIKVRPILISLQAIIVGVITGVVGVGGGFLIVPALVLLTGLTMKVAVGTSLLIIAFNSFSGFSGYIGTIDIPWDFLIPFTSLTVLGSFIGTFLSSKISQDKLRKIFAIFLVIMGIFILYKNKDQFMTFNNREKTSFVQASLGHKPHYLEKTSYDIWPQDHKRSP